VRRRGTHVASRHRNGPGLPGLMGFQSLLLPSRCFRGPPAPFVPEVKGLETAPGHCEETRDRRAARLM
jgi:hypothetical protein